MIENYKKIITVALLILASAGFLFEISLFFNLNYWHRRSRIYHHVNFMDRIKNIFFIIRFQLFYSLFFFLTGEIIWFSLVGIMVLPDIPIPEILSRLFATGIQIPFVFLIDGWIIRGLKKVFLKDVTEEDIKQAILLITILLDVYLLFVDWEMSLFITAILFGKYIWLDSEFSARKFRDYIMKLWKIITLKEHEDGTTGMAIPFVVMMARMIKINVLLAGIIFIIFRILK